MTKDEFMKRRQGNSAWGSPASEQERRSADGILSIHATQQERESSAGLLDFSAFKQKKNSSGGLTKEEFMRRRKMGDTPWSTAKQTQEVSHSRQPSGLAALEKRTKEKAVEQVQSYRAGQDKLFRQSGKSVDEWYDQRRDELEKLKKDRELTSMVEYKSQKEDLDLLEKKIKEAENDLRYAEDMKASERITAEHEAMKASGLGSEAWYEQLLKEQADASERNWKAQKAKESSYNKAYGSSAAAGEFAYMFSPSAEDEEAYGKANAEAEEAFSAFQAAKERVQIAQLFRYEDAKQSKDYKSYVQKGDESDRNKVKLADREKENILNGGYNSDVNVLMRDDYDPYFDIAPDALLAYTYMNNDERDFYSYLLGARGEDAADAYLDEIRDTLNARQGQAAADKIEKQNRGLRLFNEMGLAFGSGVEGAVLNFGQNFFSEARNTSPTEYASQYARQNIEGHGRGHVIEGIGYDAVNTMANMAPSIAVGSITGGLGGAAFMGLQSKGAAYKQALDEGYTRAQAQIYSTATGAAEAGLSYVLGGFSALGGIEQFTGKMTAQIGKAGLRAAAEIGLDIVGENTEEYLQNKLEPILRNSVFGEHNEVKLWDEEDTYTLILTTLTTGAMNAGGKAINRAQVDKVGRSWKQDGLDKELVERALQSEDEDVRSKAEALKSEGRKASDNEIGELALAYESAGEDMSFVVEHASKTDEQATKAIRDAAERERERVKERERRTQQSREEAAGGEIESASAVLGEDAKAIQAVYREGQDADKYAAAMNAGINLMAAEGTNREALDKSNLTEYLTKDQRDIAWEIGHEKYLARQQKAAEQTRRGGEREVSEIREGTVSWDGATIEGRQYAAVDRKTLSKTEQRQADASATVAKALGVDLVFYDADPQEAQGAYREGGTIYLNVRAGKSSGETLIVSAFSHELTHFAEEYGGESYEGLRSYVMQTLANNDQTKFEQLVETKRRSRGNISYEEALSEVVADGCEMMLRDTNAPAMLARENPTLLQKICDWLDGWVKKIKEAFTGVSARHEEARILMEQAEELQRRWDKALAEAVQNRENARSENESAHSENENARSENESAHSENENARSENKTTAEDGGRVQYSRDQNFSQADIDMLRSIRASHPGSGRISIFDFTSQDIRKAEKWAKQFYREMGTKSPFFRNWFGDWRANDKNGVRYIEMKNNTVNQKSRAVYNKDMSKTEEKGASINIGKDFFEDSLHYAKQGKDEKAITKLLANIDEVVENAVLLDTRLSDLDKANKKGSTQFMHILYAPISYNGAPFLAKIAVEEYREDGILRAYNAQRITMSALPRSYFQQQNQAASAGTSRLHADEIMVSQLYDLVKRYDKDFKSRPEANASLQNENGTPKVFYHGTASEFWAFDMKKANDKTGRLMGLGAGKGKIYLTEYEESARLAASGAKARTKGGSERVMPLYVSAQKIMDRADYQKILERNYERYPSSRPHTASYDYQQRDKAIAATDREVRKQGYDAVYDKNSGELFVYENTQVKSATDNIGTFDRNNPDIRYSERDNSVSDRELLREAAEREGASDELKKYGKKAENLEAYQKRLERQQKKLTAEGLGSEERAALEKRIEETEELIARTQDALTRMELRPSMQQEIQEARTRWWTENIPDAVQTAREIQKENRELRQAVQYYREQAQHTAPENRGVDKADVRRFARALLKEHGSSADVEQLSRQIQKLGEKLVQGTGADLDSRELNSIARGAARMIVDEVYTDINEGTADVLSGLSERVRGTRLQITDDLRADIPDFNAWRKARLGRMTLVNEGGTSIDELYQDLRYEYGEGYFPADVTAASDQLEQIDRALDSLKPNYQYAYTEMEREETVRLVAQEIMDTVLSGEIREAETIADRNYRKMQERMLTAREAQHKAERKAASAERRADNAEKTALRQAREEQKAITREKVKNLRQELNESREAQQKRINIERQRARLSRMLRENSAKNHVPEALRGQIGRFIQSLDTLGPFSEGTKSEARFREEMKELGLALRTVKDSTELNDFYGDMELTEGVRVMLQNNIDQVEAAIAVNEGTVTRRMTLEQLRALEETLNVLSTAIKNVNELLSDGEHRFAHIDELGEEAIRENYAIAEKKQAGGELGRQLKWANLTPYYAFKRFGETGQEIFRGITRGWGKMARHIDQIQRFAEDTYTAEEVRSWEKQEHSFQLVPRAIDPDSESAVKSGSMDLKAGAETVTLTEAQIMSLYCLNKREQARGHLYGAGIRIGDYQIGRKTTTQSEHYLLDPDDMATILKTLSPRQIEVCDALTKYMNTVGSTWGNEVSKKLYGIRGFTEENYFPIRTDSTQHKAKTADSERGNLFRLANQSFTKQLTKNANNAIIVDSVFDVFADHMADMAKYNALVLPMLDTMRWFNYQGEKSSVQQALQRAFGGEAGRYVKDFMQDLNGASEGGRGEQVFSRMMSGAKVASVGANIRVALQQPTSIARASLLINPKYLAAGAARKGGRAKALQYSGLAVWKDLGYFDVNVNRGMREQIKHADTLKQRIQDKSLWLAEKGDQMTWGALWNACELETKDKTGLTGEELMQKTAERFDEVILSTQVMDSTLTRSANMRSKSTMMKEFTAFMAEPTLTYNMLLDCWSEFDKTKRTNGTGAAVQKMKGPILRTAAVYVTTAALTAIAQAIGDAGRDDDDYETWLQKFWQHWTEDFTDNLNPLKLVPIVQDVWNIAVEKRDKNLLVLQPLVQGVQAYQIWKEWYDLETGKIDRATKTTWYGNMTAYGRIYKTLQFMSSLTGLPMGSATREFQSGYNTFLRPLLNETIGKASGKELPKWRTYDGGPQQQIKSAWEGGYLDEEQAKTMLIEEGVAKDETEAGKTVYKWGIGNTAAYKAVKEAAVKGDEKGYREAMKAMTDAGYSENDVQSNVRSAIRDQYLNPESGPELSKAYCIDYLQRFGGWSKEEAEQNAQEWTCYKVTGIAFDDIEEAYRSGEISAGRALELNVTYGPATAKLNQGWTEHAKPAGVDSASYYRFWLDAGEMRSERDADGKEIKGQKKQDKVMAYIDGLRLTREQKDALYLSMYVEKNLKNAPWNK